MPLPRSDGTRRRRHREAVLGSVIDPAAPDSPLSGSPLSGSPTHGRAVAGERPAHRAVSGTIVDASPHLLVLNVSADGGEKEIRLPMTPMSSIWHGGRSGLHALRAGRQAIVRRAADGPGIERVWVDIERVTGTILAYGRQTVEVDAGPHRGRTQVVIPPSTLGRVLVRHPRLEPGFLIDVIGIRSADGPVAVRPGTSQPGHRAEHVAPPPTAPPSATRHGTATWFGGLGERAGGLESGPAPKAGPPPGASFGDLQGGESLPARGAAYPAVDPEGDAGGCPDAPVGCAPLPYLSYGSDLVVRNECADLVDVVPVVQCGCVAARYCDRCVECGTSPRGRIVELTPAAFVDLGGDLDAGCFNASLLFDRLLDRDGAAPHPADLRLGMG